MSALLKIENLDAFYGDYQALAGIEFEVRPGEVVGVIGANGAGKTTLLRSIAGLLPCAPNAIRFQDRAIGGMAADRVVRLGIALVPESRRLFPSLSVEENLKVGAFAGRTGPWNERRVYELFPVLGERRRANATELSGGQQQMVSIGRALMSNPALLLCDELSLGLAPLVVKDIYAALQGLTQHGLAAVIVEQDVALAQRMAHRLYCLQEGRVSLEGETSSLTRERIAEAYFGV
ncbi:MAG: ABC transporter ATP-binding protein [Betaproteobacteria bacterium RIFCSPLOWO2_12_FULL_66_14]|nr:MAG: ABC transporter ATP-binding protein [Betaproteobacteria bacterium RIFCSPLOWO2_12_FULL_66_14]